MTAMTQSLTVRRIAAARMPTKWGMFQTMAFERVIVNGTRHTDTALALVLGDLTEGAPLVLGGGRTDRSQAAVELQVVVDHALGGEAFAGSRVCHFGVGAAHGPI